MSLDIFDNSSYPLLQDIEDNEFKQGWWSESF